MEQKLLGLIKDADNILVTSHISPDVDAVCSALLVFNALKFNFPDKTVNLVLEELPNQDLSFLKSYDQIKYQNLADFITKESPKLLIITDAAKLSRCSRNDGDRAKQLVGEKGIKTAVIDHHEPNDKDQTDVYINNGYPAAAQEVYHILFDKLGLNKPEGYADTTLLGILSDTMRFKYANPKHRETFALVSDLIDAGANIEGLESRIEAYTANQLSVLGHMISNFEQSSGYNYSYINDEFAQEWRSSDKGLDDYANGIDLFKNQFVRYIAPNSWGFVVTPELLPNERNYSVSLRSLGDEKDVSTIAGRLGGGGHKPAAAAKFHADSIEDALSKVIDAVENTTVS